MLLLAEDDLKTLLVNLCFEGSCLAFHFGGFGSYGGFKSLSLLGRQRGRFCEEKSLGFSRFGERERFGEDEDAMSVRVNFQKLNFDGR